MPINKLNKANMDVNSKIRDSINPSIFGIQPHNNLFKDLKQQGKNSRGTQGRNSSLYLKYMQMKTGTTTSFNLGRYLFDQSSAMETVISREKIIIEPIFLSTVFSATKLRSETGREVELRNAGGSFLVDRWMIEGLQK